MDSLPVTNGNFALEGWLFADRNVHFGEYHESENMGWKAANYSKANSLAFRGSR